MTETAEKPAKAKKPAAKKAAKKATKRVAKKPAKKAAKEAAAPVAAEAKKPRKAAAKRVVKPRRGKKGAKQHAYQLLTVGEGGATTASSLNGPFGSEKDALDDAGIMADENTTIVLFRETKRGKVQKSTKFVAGR
jgi:hypothetical protein